MTRQKHPIKVTKFHKLMLLKLVSLLSILNSTHNEYQKKLPINDVFKNV